MDAAIWKSGDRHGLRLDARARRAATASLDRGFVLSDHADWNALLNTVQQTKAERILVTHGHAVSLSRHLAERGLNALPLPTRFEGESLVATDDDTPGHDES